MSFGFVVADQDMNDSLFGWLVMFFDMPSNFIVLFVVIFVIMTFFLNPSISFNKICSFAIIYINKTNINYNRHTHTHT